MANQNARSLRKRLTRQEVKLWLKLRELKPFGFHFRKQSPIGPYIVDFACLRHRLVVEVDGGQHAFAQGLRRDATRDAFIRSQGIRVLRFWNSDIDRSLNGVVETILSELKNPTPSSPTAKTPSDWTTLPSGEG